MGDKPLLSMVGISKSFGNAVALADINLVLHQGEVLGLVGENGAGKSTLMKILAGAYSKDAGTISVRDAIVQLESPKAAADAGIAIIYQELSLFPDFTAPENIFAGRDTRSGGTPFSPLDLKGMRRAAHALLHDELAADVPLDRPVRELSLSQRQMIEIAKALARNADIIIMDEPTEALEETERRQLFATIEKLRGAGKAIIYVSHRIQELLGICGRVMVLRDGRAVADLPTEGLEADRVVSAMIGGSLAQQFPARVTPGSEVAMGISGLTRGGTYRNVSLSLRKGEILGIAGLEGSGKSALVRSLFGVRAADSGEITINGTNVKVERPADAKKVGIAFLPAERKTEGIFPDHTVGWNLSIANLRLLGRPIVRPSVERSIAADYIGKLSVKCEGPNDQITALSGGNQQKVLLARWLLTKPKILMLEEPTRGIDVRAKAEVYALIQSAAATGCSVIVVSADNAELLGLCHRVAVMFEGQVTTVLEAESATEEMLALHTVRPAKNVQDMGGPNG